MGTTAKPAKEEKKKGGAGGGGKGKGDKREKASRGPHPGANLPIPAPRLRGFYQETVRPKLKEQFGFTNPHEIPTLEKIVINVGLGEAIKQPRLLDGIVEELATITGQHPVKKKAKKSIANFGLRQGQEIGAAVTLRGPIMWEFLDRLIAIAIPRIRDFRGLPTKSFDGRGNYSMGLKEQMMFPEINYDDIEMIHGMDITLVTSAERDDHALALLKELGMPFRTTEDKKGGR
jgi:large subunit ribosomal protein L5